MIKVVFVINVFCPKIHSHFYNSICIVFEIFACWIVISLLYIHLFQLLHPICVYNFSNYPNLLLTLFFCCLASAGISFRKCKCSLFGSLHVSCQTSQTILHPSHAERDEDFNVYNHCSVDRHKPVNKHSYRFISRALESHSVCSKQRAVHRRGKHIICTLWLKKTPRALQDGEQYFPLTRYSCKMNTLLENKITTGGLATYCWHEIQRFSRLQ